MRRLRQEDFPRYGDVRIVDLEPVVGSEIGKRRPAQIVSNDASNERSDTVTVLPMTSQPPKRQYLYEVIVPEGVAGLTRRSRIKANMIRTVDKSRLVRPLGALPDRYARAVNGAIAIHLNLR